MALVAGTGLAAVTGVGSAAASPAHRPHVVKTLPGDYIAPLQFAVSGRTVAVADSGASALYLVGHPKPIAFGGTPTKNPEASGDLAGVDVEHGRIGYTQSNADHTDTRFTVLHHGKKVLQVSLSRYEKHHNPDGRITYGFTDPSKVSDTCREQMKTAGLDVVYRGQVDSHPYAVAGLRDGSWLVADAGGNDILRISQRGHVSTVAVLPPQTVTIGSELAGRFGVTACIGLRYRFEAVPTDVEVSKGGIWATTLPGGAGGLGSVYRVGWSGWTHRVATGFAEATNLAVSPSGRIYVVQLGQGVFTPTKHGPKLVAALPGAAAVEWANGRLYASTAPAVTGGTGPGHVVVLK
ncbi:hypothetical protein CLV52_0997 [Amnibacterium kyonggiense]|uniref:ScyD/ScyE family protein n=1 Tax=Amnibacterium kyonggiense TaxID=595671 RepID=A0A4R7FRK9_9MICO|nr:hypothetical protein CLV52_0997 [Amnibacterium kyonggiense]